MTKERTRPNTRRCTMQLWILLVPDSDTTHHVTPHDQVIKSPQSYTGQCHIQLGNGSKLSIKHFGDGIISNSTTSFSLRNILHVPFLNTSLLSVHQFSVDNDCYLIFHPFHVFVKDQATHMLLLRGTHNGSIYKIAPTSPSIHTTWALVNLWCQHLRHPQESIICNVTSHYHLSISSSKFNRCHACLLGKSCWHLHLLSTLSKCSTSLELIHSDFGDHHQFLQSMASNILLFYWWFLSLIWLYSMRQKCEVAQIFKDVHILVEWQLNHKIEALQSDFGGKY